MQKRIHIFEGYGNCIINNRKNIMKPKRSAKINLFLLFIIICILYFLYFKRVQHKMFIEKNEKEEIERVEP